jgi:hypothetical protein
LIGHGTSPRGGAHLEVRASTSRARRARDSPTTRPFPYRLPAARVPPRQAPLWWFSALPADRSPHLWLRGVSAILPFALASIARAVDGLAVVPLRARRLLGGGSLVWAVWALFVLTLVESAAHELLWGLTAGNGSDDLLPFTHPDLVDVVFNGVALLLLALALPTPGGRACAPPPGDEDEEDEPPPARWRVDRESGMLCCALPLWWPWAFTSAHLAFLYQIGSHTFFAHVLVALVALGRAVHAGADHWLQARLAGVAVQSCITLVSGANGIFRTTLSSDEPALRGDGNAAILVVTAWSKANGVLVLCLGLYSLLSPHFAYVAARARSRSSLRRGCADNAPLTLTRSPRPCVPFLRAALHVILSTCRRWSAGSRGNTVLPK